MLWTIAPYLLIAALALLVFTTGLGAGVSLKPRVVVGFEAVAPLAPSAPTLVEGVRAEAKARIAELEAELAQTRAELAQADDQVVVLRAQMEKLEGLRAKWHRLYKRNHLILKAFIANPAMRLPQPWHRYQTGFLA